MPIAVVTSDRPRRSPRVWPWLVLAALVVACRATLFVWHGTIAFDSDQAVVGLMAKHIAEGRAFPVFQYALPYILILSAWIAVPFMWLMGPTIAALKAPLLLMNVAFGGWLVRAIARSGVRPDVAFMLSLPVLAVAPITAAGLMDALGMTIEPLVFIALLWATRRSPVSFGVVAAIGFLVREFVAYGVAAAWLADLVDGRARTRAGVQHWALVALAFLGSKASIDALNRFGSAAGPGSWFPEQGGDNLTVLSGAFCFDPHQALTNVLALGQWYLGLLLGALPARVSDGAVQTTVRQGTAWLWPLLALTLLVLVFRLAAHWRTVWARRTTPAMQLALFLTAVGAQAVLAYAISRCSLISLPTFRYGLLGIFLPTGLGLSWYLVDPSRWLKRGVLAVFAIAAIINLGSHLSLWREQIASPRLANRAQLAEVIEARGIRFARSDYWTAYYVSFVSEERVIVGSTGFSRIDLYERLLDQQTAHVPTILMEPCGDDTPPVVPGFWICSSSRPPD